jgi:ATP synthase protein I
MTDHPRSPVPGPGAPFAVMLRGALVPASLAGVVTLVVLVLVRGGDALAGGALGLVVSLVFYASGMFLLSRLVRSTSPHAFFAVAMTVYLAQVILLLLFIYVFRGAPWVDGPALGITALVVTLAWQAFAYRALRTARLPVYDEPDDEPGDDPDATRGGAR